MLAKLRRFVRSTAANVLHYSGAAESWRLLRQRALHRDEVCVFGLHRVLTKAEQSLSNSLDGMVLTDVTFAQLLEYLQREFSVISFEALFADGRQADPSKPRCLLTFDDGWKDTYTRAYPCLKKFGMPAMVFLAAGAIESRRGFWVEDLRRLWKMPPARAQMKSDLRRLAGQNGNGLGELEQAVEWLKHMPTEIRDSFLAQLIPQEVRNAAPDGIDCMLTWDDVLEMSRKGIDMGAHTLTHPLLTFESASTVERELRLSKHIVEEKTRKPVAALAYPNGDWNEDVRRCAERVGYRCAFTTRPGWFDRRQDPYTIRRILLHEGNVTDRHGHFSPAMLNLTLAGRV
jgi:peptidoglycan/xylan/chitin deacetylase (PgdA/CDA1 family)